MVRAASVQLLAGCCLRDAIAEHASLGALLTPRVPRAVSGRLSYPATPWVPSPWHSRPHIGTWMQCALRVPVHPRSPAKGSRPGTKEARGGGPEGCTPRPQARMLSFIGVTSMCDFTF